MTRRAQRRKCLKCTHRPVKARSLCRSCWNWEKRYGRLDQWPKAHRHSDEVLEDLDFLIERRVEATNWPERLDMTPSALERMLYRAGRHDLARQVSRERRRRDQERMMAA